MADETETPTESNGASPPRADHMAAERAAFLAGVDVDAATDEKPVEKAREVAEDDDSDLDEDDKVEASEDEEEEAEDDDADLEEEDEEKAEEEKDDDKDVDPDTAKRLSQVRRTDKRLREQRDRELKAREAEIESRAKEYEGRVQAEIERWKPRLESAERFEKLASRVDIDPVAVLQALGLQEDRYEHAAQVLYTLAKAKDDPKARAAAAQIMKAREVDDELTKLKDWRKEREKADEEREVTAKADAQWTAFFDRVVKTASDKTPLAKAFLERSPTKATERIMVLTYEITKQSGGTVPKEREVMIALEKDRRQILRDLGIDPKSISATKATAVIDAKTKTKAKSGSTAVKTEKKTANGKSGEDTSPVSRDDFVALGGKFD